MKNLPNDFVSVAALQKSVGMVADMSMGVSDGMNVGTSRVAPAHWATR